MGSKMWGIVTEPVLSYFACLQKGYGDIISNHFRSRQQKVSRKHVTKYGPLSPLCQNMALLPYHSIYSILTDKKVKISTLTRAVLLRIPKII